MSKIALITGITGQDGAYLAEFLLAKGYEVHGIKRRASSFNTDRIDHLYQDPHERGVGLETALRRPDGRDQPDPGRPAGAARRDLQPGGAEPRGGLASRRPSTRPMPTRSARCGCSRPSASWAWRRRRASTRPRPRRCTARCRRSRRRRRRRFIPRSPYGAAKLYAYWITVNYREAYGLYACNGILFNHESPDPRRDVRHAQDHPRARAHSARDSDQCLYLGNLDALRDWGHARDYVEAQWLMLQQETPDDYVIATGEQHSVREFVERVAAELGHRDRMAGRGRERGGRRPGDRASASSKVDPRYFRPAEVETLLGDSTKARTRLGWKPEISFDGAREGDGGGRRRTGPARRAPEAPRLPVHPRHE